MKVVDFPIDTVLGRYKESRAPVTDGVLHILLANVLQTVSVSGGLV
jgi:hypothetical protein